MSIGRDYRANADDRRDCEPNMQSVAQWIGEGETRLKQPWRTEKWCVPRLFQPCFDSF
jgi:hypothetical protein